jgi:toxin ParE1/3/4
MEVTWSRRAAHDLEDLAAYIQQHQPKAAQDVALRILTLVDLLTDQPEMGRPGRVVASRELVVTGTPYIVAYRVKGNTIGIARVIHGARKWPKLL